MVEGSNSETTVQPMCPKYQTLNLLPMIICLLVVTLAVSFLFQVE